MVVPAGGLTAAAITEQSSQAILDRAGQRRIPGPWICTHPHPFVWTAAVRWTSGLATLGSVSKGKACKRSPPPQPMSGQLENFSQRPSGSHERSKREWQSSRGFWKLTPGLTVPHQLWVIPTFLVLMKPLLGVTRGGHGPFTAIPKPPKGSAGWAQPLWQMLQPPLAPGSDLSEQPSGPLPSSLWSKAGGPAWGF